MFPSTRLRPGLIPFLVTAALWLGSPQTRAVVVVGPLLEGLTTTNVYVLAECSVDASSPMTVNYGPTASYGFSATTLFTKTTGQGTTNVHRIKLTGLAPNTLYHYQLVGQGLTSPDYTFRTLVNAGNNFRFVWQADFRSNPTLHDQIAGRVLNTAQSLFVLEGGDTCLNGDWAGWHTEFFTGNEKALERTLPIYPTPGNHEDWTTPPKGTLTQAYYQSPDSTGANGYYSFDCGDLHVTMANFMAPYTNGSVQYAWIQQDVQSSLKPWKIFGTHAPAYTYGGSHVGDAGFQTITANILQPNGVKVFLAGHNHFYQHNLVNGIHHLTVGAAGAPLTVPTNHPTYTILSLKTNCYMVLDVSATNLHMVAYYESVRTLETNDLYKLPAPVNVAATAADGQAVLTWNAVAGATNYSILYGIADGGPYPSQTNSTGASVTVAGLNNGTTFYFVVTASDTNGPSAISAQVAATPYVTPAITSSGMLDDRNFGLSGTGGVGQAYVLVTATNLVWPVAWTPIATNVATSGWFSFSDLQATNFTQRFYRVRTP